MESSKWQLYRNYIFLIPLFAIALFYQVSYTFVAVYVTAHSTTTPSRPFGTSEQIVTAVDQKTAASGLHPGDRVVAINGQEFVGDHVLMEQIQKLGPKDQLVLAVIPKGEHASRMVRVPARFWDEVPATAWTWTLVLVLSAIMLLCLLVGIYVAAALPYDIRAITVFGLMLSTSQLVSVNSWYNFPRPLWVFADAIHMIGVGSWSLWAVLFAIYFPRRFAWDLKRPWQKWTFVVPLILVTGLEVIASIGAYDNFQSFSAVSHAIDIPALNNGVLMAVAIAFFFTCIGAKIASTRDPDSGRRLRILMAGSLLGLMPVGGFVLYRAMSSKGEEFNRISEAIIISVALLFCLFPLTVAYVVVAERAMRLSMVVRQGARYALAKGGLRVLIALVATVVYSLLNSLLWTNLSLAPKIITIFASIIIISSITRTTRRRIMLSIDRRFFREAYNTEVLLQDLGETAHSIVNEQELLETVAHRISETLHVPQVAILLNRNGAFHPVFCLGIQHSFETLISENSKTIDLVTRSTEPAPIYFDRRDNWVHAAPETEVGTLKSMHAELLLPVSAKKKLLGLFCLGPKLSEEPYSSTDIQLLRTVALQTGLALENSRLTTEVATEMAQREKLNREVEIAREVQERLFPQFLPAIAGIDFSGACRPALGVGGDYYDFLPLANGDLGIAIGDVSGKGIAAALLMASLQASLRGQVMTNQGDLARLMTNVNQLIYGATPVNRYATFFYGQYNHNTRLFTYVNAGHNPPIILRRNGQGVHHTVRLETGGPVIGLFPDVPYQQGCLVLEPGDVFVGFTDGISEAMNNQDEEWGEERFIPAIAAQADRCASDMIPALMQEADNFVSGAPQHDDMTLVVFKLAAAA